MVQQPKIIGELCRACWERQYHNPRLPHLRSLPLCLPTVQVMPYAKETRREKEKARAAKRRASGPLSELQQPCPPRQVSRCDSLRRCVTGKGLLHLRNSGQMPARQQPLGAAERESALGVGGLSSQ